MKAKVTITMPLHSEAHVGSDGSDSGHMVVETTLKAPTFDKLRGLVHDLQRTVRRSILQRHEW